MMYGEELQVRMERVIEILSAGVPDGDRLGDGKPFAKLTARFPESADSDFGPPGRATLKRVAYFAERLRGVDHVWAAMTASRRGPAVNTDVTLFQGHRYLGDQFENDAQLQKVVAAAKANGYTPNQGDMYIPGLAAYPGDRAAFVSATGGRGHIAKLLEERNWSGHGVVSRTADDRGEGEISSGPILANDLAMKKALERGMITDKNKGELPDILQQMRTEHGVSNERLSGYAGNATASTPAHTFTTKQAKKPRPPKKKKEQ